MRRWVLLSIAYLVVCAAICNARKEDDKAIASQKTTKNQGEVVCVDTGLYCFTIRDEIGNETKFYAPGMKLRMINIGEKIQVSYKKTTDGKLKALGIKQVKEKKKHKRQK